jgi:hypothetical protein
MESDMGRHRGQQAIDLFLGQDFIGDHLVQLFSIGGDESVHNGVQGYLTRFGDLGNGFAAL